MRARSFSLQALRYEGSEAQLRDQTPCALDQAPHSTQCGIGSGRMLGDLDQQFEGSLSGGRRVQCNQLY